MKQLKSVLSEIKATKSKVKGGVPKIKGAGNKPKRNKDLENKALADLYKKAKDEGNKELMKAIEKEFSNMK